MIPTAGAPVTPRSVGLPPGRGPWRRAFDRFARNRCAVAASVLLLIITFACLLGPVLSPYNHSEIFWDAIATGPSTKHIFGTDTYGRDLFVRILIGGRISLAVGLLSTVVSLVIGVVYGAIAGFAGGKTDEMMMRIIDVLYALPFMFFVIVLMVVFGRNIFLIFIAIGAIGWLTMARVVRGQAMSLRRELFVEAAIASGLRKRHIISRHIIPNLLGPVVVFTTLMIPQVILTESFLSFLGLGVQEPLASWGTLISEGASGVETSPWLLIFPALFLSVSLYALNAIGDGLRDALDPKSR